MLLFFPFCFVTALNVHSTPFAQQCVQDDDDGDKDGIHFTFLSLHRSHACVALYEAAVASENAGLAAKAIQGRLLMFHAVWWREGDCKCMMYLGVGGVCM